VVARSMEMEGKRGKDEQMELEGIFRAAKLFCTNTAMVDR